MSEENKNDNARRNNDDLSPGPPPSYLASLSPGRGGANANANTRRARGDSYTKQQGRSESGSGSGSQMTARRLIGNDNLDYDNGWSRDRSRSNSYTNQANGEGSQSGGRERRGSSGFGNQLIRESEALAEELKKNGTDNEDGISNRDGSDNNRDSSSGEMNGWNGWNGQLEKQRGNATTTQASGSNDSSKSSNSSSTNNNMQDDINADRIDMYRGNKGAAEEEQTMKQQMEARAKVREQKNKKKNPLMQIFKILWPFPGFLVSPDKEREMSGGKDPDRHVGRTELVSIFLVSCLRTWHQDRMVYVKRSLMEATYKRDATLFRSVLNRTLLLSVLSSVIFALHRFLKEKLTLAWRAKLTRQLHREYFSNMASYKISHMNQGKIGDVEERITRDPRRFAKGLADEMEKLSAAITSGLWFTYKLTTISSLPYALSPLAYFYVAYRASMLVSPNWSKRWRTMLDKRGVYQKAQSRLQTHSEAICAYQGNDRERRIIDDVWSDFLAYCVDFVKDASLFQFAASAFFEYGAHSFAEALIIGRFVRGGGHVKDKLRNAKTAKEKVTATADLFAETRYLTEYFIRAMSAQGTIISVLRQLQNMRGPAKRLTELYDTLYDFAEQRKQESGTTFRNSPDTIAFTNAQVYTPTGHLLVKDLNFEIKTGTNMLLTGVNGSGKSSIFRCLGALWSIPEGGHITKPGGNEEGLNKDVFYLPQKPYSVLGTLRDQLSYPATQSESASISHELLKELLEEVDLGYLLDRKMGVHDDQEVNWETVLSLGEKQRLAMARLFYHAPKFAILDECTSGVSASMEKRLYQTCERRGITCITISHRPVLEQYHDVVLNILADGKGGWTWRETGRNQMRRQGSTASDLQGRAGGKNGDGDGGDDDDDDEGEGDALVERERLKERSAPYEKLDQMVRSSDGSVECEKVSTKQRLLDVMQRFMPNGASIADREMQRILLLAGMIVGKTLLADAIARYDGYIVSTVVSDSMGKFARAVATGAFFRTFLAFFDAMLMRQKWYLNLEWRRRLTKYLMDLYFTQNTFYDIQNHDERIPDPDERIGEQVEQLSIALTDLWTSLLKPAFDIGFNTVMLYRVLGLKGITYTTGYMAAGLALMRFLIPNFRALRRKEFDLEGRFRFVHNRLVDHTESIAFFGGDQVEHEIADRRFDDLGQHIENTHWQTLRFNTFNNFSIKQMPDLIAFALRMLYAESFGDDDAVVAGEDDGTHSGSGGISAQGEWIQQTVMRSFRSFGEAFDLQETIGQFVGVLENVTDFMYVLEDIASKQGTARRGHYGEEHSGTVAKSTDGSIAYNDVDIVAPGNICCCSDLTFRVKPGEPLIVTGPNASGKSSLFRTLGGLWPIPKGTIQRPANSNGIVTPKQVFLVPQKPYSVTGTLADQITYPEKIDPEERTQEHEDQLMKLMELVRVPYLVSREGGWDAESKWEDTLSLGEQQRIGCARLFYHNPQYAVLDECTSAVSIDVEEALYRAANERGITSITISQRLALEEFHSHELRMGDCEGAKGWSHRAIRKETDGQRESKRIAAEQYRRSKVM